MDTDEHRWGREKGGNFLITKYAKYAKGEGIRQDAQDLRYEEWILGKKFFGRR
jgi:hypothetical protein